jgi:capsular polysaccharide biosynthesis protein
LYNSRLNSGSHVVPADAEPAHRVSMDSIEGEYDLSLRDLFRVIWNRLWVIVLVAGILTGGTVAFSLAQTPIYTASIQILVGQERGAPDAPRDDVLSLQKLTETIAEAVSSRRVAEIVINQQGLQTTSEDFLGKLNVEQTRDTQL